MPFDATAMPRPGLAAPCRASCVGRRLLPRALAASLLAIGAGASFAGAADLAVPAQFGSIQSAIDAAIDGDRVLVAAGTYREQVNLRGKGVRLVSIDGAEVTAIDGEGLRSVVVGHGEPDTCLVQGFTIRDGRDHGYHNGGGVKLSHSSARFVDCRFVGNRAEAPGWWGAGAWRSEYGNPRIERCAFIGNYGGGNVAGVYHYLGGGITVSDCVFVDNESASGQCVHIQTEGGAITAAISGCTFRRFGATQAGAGCFPVAFWNPYGGTISCAISDCVAEEPVPAAGTDPATIAFMAIGAYPGSTYHVSLAGIRSCGLPNFVMSDGNSSWNDFGGHLRSAECCPADVTRDGLVDGGDLGVALSRWGECLGCVADLTGDGQVGGDDLGALLSGWGGCP